MAKLWRRPADNEKDDMHVHEVDLKTLRVDKPSLIFLNGFFIMDKNKKWIAASLKAMEDMMAERPGPKSPVDVYSWSHAGLKDVFNVLAYNANPGSRACAAVRKLAAGLIMPLVAKDFKVDDKGNASGSPLPAEEARKNLRNITFFGYSAGCITAQECFNASLQMMKKIGYDEKDARGILSEVVYIGVGNVSRPGKEKHRFTSLLLEATNDKIVRFKNRLWTPLRVFFSRFVHPLKIKPLSATSAVISASVARKSWETRVLKDGRTIREKVRSLLPSSGAIFKTYHELPRYATQDEALSPFAKMVQYGLTNAVGRTGPLDPLHLLEPPPGVEAATAAAYRGKIEKAWVKPLPAIS